MRHHAVDALVIALADGDKIRRLAVMSAESEEYGKNWKKVEFPLVLASGEALKDVVGRVVENVVVSHRVSCKISGPLHKETNYRAFEDEKGPRRAHRQELPKFTEATIKEIVDQKIRNLVLEKWKENGGKAEKFATNPPFMTARGGRKIPIKKARYSEAGKTLSVGKGKRNRRVVSEKNSHMEVYAVIDGKGKEKKNWKGDVIRLIDAYCRKLEKKPVVCRKPGKTKKGEEMKFLFSLRRNETFALGEQLFVVRSISIDKNGYSRIFYTTINKKNDEEKSLSPGQFKANGFCKMRVDVLGRVYPANE